MPTRLRPERTMARHIIVVTPRYAARAARAASGQVEWCYVGVDASQRASVAEALPKARWRPMGDALTRMAGDVKPMFLDWVADIGRGQRNQVNWWASALASSSPLQTDLFLNVCYTRLVREWLRSNEAGLPRLVIVEDPWLALTLRRQFARDPRVICVGCRLGACLQDALSWLIRIPRVLAARLVLTL